MCHLCLFVGKEDSLPQSQEGNRLQMILHGFYLRLYETSHVKFCLSSIQELF